MNQKPLERFWAKVDKTETCWLWTGGKKSNGYGSVAVRWEGKEHRYPHRFSYTLANGPIPDGLHIDHICHRRLCVNPEHLRVATPKQNLENVGVLRGDNTSGYRGVSWDKKNKKWSAAVQHHGRMHHVGRFVSIEEANAAAIAKRNELFTHNDLDKKAA